jgi:hypothetical protein
MTLLDFPCAGKIFIGLQPSGHINAPLPIPGQSSRRCSIALGFLVYPAHSVFQITVSRATLRTLCSLNLKRSSTSEVRDGTFKSGNGRISYLVPAIGEAQRSDTSIVGLLGRSGMHGHRRSSSPAERPFTLRRIPRVISAPQYPLLGGPRRVARSI